MLVVLLRAGPGSGTTLNGLFEWAPRLRKLVVVLPYEELERHDVLHCGTLVFADHERLRPSELAAARDLAVRVRDAQPALRVLNDPHRTVRRFDLLRRLHEAGINEFRAFRLFDVPDDVRLPVFLRFEDDHKGPLTELLARRKDLDGHIERLNSLRRDLRQALAVEFVDVSDEEGVFHKYSSFIVDGEVIPRHVIFSRRWCLKVPDLHEEQRQTVEEEYFEGNPHREQIGELARLAGADYGKFDYALKDGRIQVWEFNTNPAVTPFAAYRQERLHLEQRFRDALADALGRLATSAADVPVPVGVAPGTFGRV